MDRTDPSAELPTVLVRSDLVGTAGPTSQGLRPLATTFAELGRRVESSSTSATLHTIVEMATERLHAAAVSVPTLYRARFATTAATDDRARGDDALQYGLGSGPCVDAIRENAIFSCDDRASDQRWPAFRTPGRQRVRFRQTARLSTQLRLHDRTRRHDCGAQRLWRQTQRLRRRRPDDRRVAVNARGHRPGRLDRVSALSSCSRRATATGSWMSEPGHNVRGRWPRTAGARTTRSTRWSEPYHP